MKCLLYVAVILSVYHATVADELQECYRFTCGTKLDDFEDCDTVKWTELGQDYKEDATEDDARCITIELEDYDDDEKIIAAIRRKTTKDAPLADWPSGIVITDYTVIRTTTCKTDLCNGTINFQANIITLVSLLAILGLYKRLF